jgi:CRISPR-associated endonuclease/helicase Cas3
MRERAANKADRLLQIEQLLLDHPDGLTQSEIARRIGVHRSTINRYLPDLTNRFPIYDTADGRIAIDRDSYLTEVRFTLHEAMAVHLAARLMTKSTDKQNPHAASALSKLAASLARLAPFISDHVRYAAEVMQTEAQRHDPVYLDVLEKLTRAWSRGHKVKLKHQMDDGSVYDYTFAPYYIEPYPLGRTSHVIGRREPPDAVRTFKIERIRTVELTEDPYTLPADFDPAAHLADAWGIWTREGEPVEVVLRFHPRVVRRVQETRWHRNEETELQPDGWLIWRAPIAEPREMLPWVRGWGGDVRVLAPEDLRKEVVKEVKKMALLYEVGDLKPSPLFHRLWSKTSRRTQRTHPLICHMIDVGVVARALWDQVFTERFRTHVASILDLEPDRAGALIAFWASLHDLGKATPAFQRKHAPAEAELRENGLQFPKAYGRSRFYHGTATTRLLPDVLTAETGASRRLAVAVARAVGGHHGTWPISRETQGLKSFRLGDTAWENVRRNLVERLAEVFEPPASAKLDKPRAQQNTLFTLLSGITSVADWMGSMVEYFPFVDLPVDVDEYAEDAAAQANYVLTDLKWTGWHPPSETRSFSELFHLPAPRPMQAKAVELAHEVKEPALVIIEAPTGVGKTEAALYMADTWACTLRQRGMYVAMPTMATSNQMHERVAKVLRDRYPGISLSPLLIHSQARWMQDSLPSEMNVGEGEEEEAIEAMTWFLPRKRSLLAPFGVGTVDQAFMSVLQTKHFFVRLLGLSHKTLIFDEVHAYDTYMSKLFQRLLGWLRAVGTSVIILSATLPEKTRRQLITAYAGEGTEMPDVTYPAITWAVEGKADTIPVTAPERRTIHLGWLERSPEAIAAHLETALEEGGCAAVICNTVRRSQDVYRALQASGAWSEEETTLFHARFPFGWRQSIEADVLSHFGKRASRENGQRPHRAVVVATQVIEQSLDLDFDVMVSDLAPADLLIQRAGRLHRHARADRPKPLTHPHLWITRPDAVDRMPDFGADAFVYESYVLLRTFAELQDRETWTLPDDTTASIEAVYGEEEPDAPHLAVALVEARQAMTHHETEDVDDARRRLIAEPGDKSLMKQTNAELTEDAPEVHRALQALTRKGSPSISVVCLHRHKDELHTQPDAQGTPIDLTQKPSNDLTQTLVGATLSLSHRGVFWHLLKNVPPPSGWHNHALLQTYRALIFEHGVCPLEGSPYTLYLTPSLGLIVEKEAS